MKDKKMAEQSLKKITQAELDEILKQHQLWLNTSGKQGQRADLSYCDLRGLAFPFKVSLSGANLEGANLARANLKNTILEQNQEKSLAQELVQQQLKVSQLENELAQIKSETSPSQEQQERIAQLETQLEAAKQQEQELQKIKAEKEKLEKEIQDILKNNISEANDALINALTNTDEQIKNNQKFTVLLKWAAVALLGLDIAFVLAMPFIILYSKFYELLDKVGIWAILFFTFPAILILLIALSLLRHQKQLIAEIRHYSMLKHKIELYGGILKAAQFTASSVMQSQDSESAQYIKQTFDEIKTELLKSPNFDLNAQPHIFPEDGGNLVEMLKSTMELVKTSTETSKAAAESVKKNGGYCGQIMPCRFNCQISQAA